MSDSYTNSQGSILTEVMRFCQKGNLEKQRMNVKTTLLFIQIRQINLLNIYHSQREFYINSLNWFFNFPCSSSGYSKLFKGFHYKINIQNEL